MSRVRSSRKGEKNMSSKFNDERVKQDLSTATVFEVTPQECHVEKYADPVTQRE